MLLMTLRSTWSDECVRKKKNFFLCAMQPGTIVNVEWKRGMMRPALFGARRAKAQLSTTWTGTFQSTTLRGRNASSLAPPDAPFTFTTLCQVAPSYLKCPICLEVFQAPKTIAKCMHTFCARCISSSTQCAICAVSFEEGDLVRHPIVAGLSAALVRGEFDAASILSAMKDNQDGEVQAGVQGPLFKCRKCGGMKQSKQIRCGAACQKVVSC